MKTLVDGEEAFRWAGWPCSSARQSSCREQQFPSEWSTRRTCHSILAITRSLPNTSSLAPFPCDPRRQACTCAQCVQRKVGTSLVYCNCRHEKRSSQELKWQTSVIWVTRTCTHTHARTHSHARAHTHTRARAHAHTYTRARAQTHARTHAHKHTIEDDRSVYSNKKHCLSNKRS